MALSRAALARSLVTVASVVAAAAVQEIEILRLSPSSFHEAPAVVREGGVPFVLAGIGHAWEAYRSLTLERLEREFNRSIADYYPENLIKIDSKPYLIPLGEALAELRAKQQPQYIQWRMNLPDAEKFLKLVEPLPSMFRSRWERQCFPDYETNDNFRRVTAWNMVLIGNRGAGMFQHWDSFHTGTWQAQIVGTKEWTLCHPDDAHYFGDAGIVNTFSRKFLQSPSFAKARCARFKAHAGDLVFYPSNWWHETRNLDTPCIGMAGRIVTMYNFEDVYDSLLEQCEDPGRDLSKIYEGAAPNLDESTCQGLELCREIWTGLYEQQHDYNEESSLLPENDIQHTDPLCRIPANARLDCNLPTKEQCAAAGCCWRHAPATCGRERCPVCYAPQ